MTRLDVITFDPPNAATPLALLDGRLLDAEDVYVRSNFRHPSPAADPVELVLPGQTSRFTVADLSRLPQTRVSMVLECAGNGRTLMDPVPDGTPWGLGGASPVQFGGVRLPEILEAVPDEITELVFTGRDRGEVAPGENAHYQFSLQRGDWGRALLAHSLGSDSLTHDHGGPIRLVVPGHYAMKSVKWLARIEAVTSAFRGHFVDKYRYFGDEAHPDGAPVREIEVRSIVARPAPGQVLTGPDLTVTGAAWSGHGPVTSVEISLDDGASWSTTEVEPAESAFAASSWSTRVALAPGRHSVMARARDAAGNIQPLEPLWNRNGYGNNVVHRVEFEVSGQQG